MSNAVTNLEIKSLLGAISEKPQNHTINVIATGQPYDVVIVHPGLLPRTLVSLSSIQEVIGFLKGYLWALNDD